MSAPPTTQGPPITDKAQLVEYLAQGSKPASAWRIGTEHEKFVFTRADLRPAPYEDIRALLESMQRFGWDVIEENGRPIALMRDKGAITLEPAGQFELSGAPLDTIHEVGEELDRHLAEVHEVAGKLGIGFLGMGFEPKAGRADMPLMPKARSDIMRRYMPKVGSMGLDMMHRTATVQVNLDFASEADMVAKFRAGLALQPLATALFAASPFKEGKPSGYLSYRSHVWTDTDNGRAGMLPFVFEDGFGFERYVDYLLDVPMYFVFRDGGYVDAAGQSFKDFLAGRLPALPGETPYLGDWADHMTTAFPEVRLKRYLEMRGADCGRRARLTALPAFWVGLLYDAQSLAEAGALIKDWTVEEMAALRRDVPKLGLKTPFRTGTLRNIAHEVVAIAQAGLVRRARLDAQGRDESRFLDPLVEIAESGETAAEKLLNAYHARWNGSVDPAFEEEAL